MKRRIVILFSAVLGIIALNWAAANWILWSRCDRLGNLFSPAFRLAVNHDKHVFELTSGVETHLTASQSKAHFAGGACDFSETRQALSSMANAVPVSKRFLAALWLRPFVTGVTTAQGERCWSIRFAGGRVAVAVRDGLPREIRWRNVLATFRRAPPAGVPTGTPVRVEARDLDKSLAAVLRVLALQLVEVPREPDTRRREGNGSLEIKNGHRILRLRGKPYEIGFQHGRLLAPNIHRLCERIVYGVGFYYSIEKGQWFLDEAAKLVERQRPFIAPEYFEEMRGLADGAGLPVALAQAANIFPEFFHCSGVAVFGKATRDGRLFHARVLDYMTEVGLQDEAVTMAVEREGARRFVNVSYAGFIGSVTGMNEKQVAIGEMGGRGEGDWDGTPMAQLLRGALENCDTLEEALDYMRRRPRTCEYYYVISDGKSRTARGVAATSKKFEVVKPGEAVPLLPEPVEDTVLLSAEDRYTELVERVRNLHGQIGTEEMQRIIARGVAMKSNLHNAIFEPPALTLWITHASRHEPACDKPYVKYTWDELFPDSGGGDSGGGLRSNSGDSGVNSRQLTGRD